MKISRRQLLKGLGACSVAGTGTILYTLFVEPHWLEIVRRKLPIANLPGSLVGKTLVQISDIHIGPRVDDRYLSRSFDLVKALAPDIVVYTGDLTDYEPQILEHAGRMLPQLPLGKLGTFGILGNHDYGMNWQNYTVADQIANIAEANGVRMLRNATGDAGGLKIMGFEDLWSKKFDTQPVMEDLNSGAPSLVLTHNPDTVDLPVWGNFAGWMLAGHTHGGQCKPPFLPPPMLPVENRRYTAGEFQLSGNRRLYINKGLGHVFKARFNVRPEITVFELESAPPVL